MDIIYISINDLGTKYPKLEHGEGVEGIVYDYDCDNVLKIFKNNDPDYTDSKCTKLIDLAVLNNFVGTIPNTLVFIVETNQLGYLLNKVTTNSYRNFKDLSNIQNNFVIYPAISKLSVNLELNHKRKYVYGDLHSQNVMINKFNDPILIDSDNVKTPNCDFSFHSHVMQRYEITFGNKCSEIDNDKYLLTLISLQAMIKNFNVFSLTSPEEYQQFIQALNITKYQKSILECILSNSNNKPYVGELTNDLDPGTQLLLSNNFRNKIKGITQ